MMGLKMPDMRIDLPFRNPLIQIPLLNITYYGDDLHFNSTHAAFSLSKNVLEIKIPSADIITHRIYEAKCIKK